MRDNHRRALTSSIRCFALLLFATTSSSNDGSTYGSDLPRDLQLNFSGQVAWDARSDTLRFVSSGTMPASREDFFWKVPKHVRRIEIDANVTVTGGFRVRYRDKANPLTIAGKNRKTSVIHGTDQSDWTATANIAEADKWRYSAISVIIETSQVRIQPLRGERKHWHA